jgi:hypothetical protein
MHFAINRTTQAPISDINEFEDQQIEYAKHLQDEGTRYTYDMFQHQLMQRAHIDPELFHLRDKEKRDIYRRIISHLKTELEFKRAEFDTIKHKDEVASYEQKKLALEKIRGDLEGMKGEFIEITDFIQFARQNATNMRKMTLDKIKKICTSLNKASNYLLSVYSIKNVEIHEIVKRRVSALNLLIGEIKKIIDEKHDAGDLSNANTKMVTKLLIPIDTTKIKDTIPITPQKKASEHIDDADQQDLEDAKTRKTHEAVKSQMQDAKQVAEQQQASSIIKSFFQSIK